MFSFYKNAHILGFIKTVSACRWRHPKVGEGAHHDLKYIVK